MNLAFARISNRMIARRFKIEYIIIAIFIAFNLVLHLFADLNSGYHGDELLHIEAGRHLAFGYMDFSPMIAYIAFIQNLFQSQSIVINHLFLHIATASIIVFFGLITIELGGKWLAILMTLSCILFSPGFGVTQSLFLPDVFDQLAWVICIYFLIKYCKNPESKYLIYIGISFAIGFLTKYTIVFLIFGLFLSFLIFQFNILKRKALWISLIIFLIIILPNILWQFNNGFPVFHHFSKLYETQLDNISFIQEFKSLFIYLNPFTSVFWITGLIVIPFLHNFKTFRLVIFTLLFAFLFLILAKGKSYYYYPIILCILPFSGVFFEQMLHQRKWILLCYLSLICFTGIIVLPNGIPILPLDKYIKYYNFKKNRDNRIPLPFENYYSREIWNEILSKVDRTYRNLSVAEQNKCLIWGRHYSQAGGINLLGKPLGLPQAFSFHSSFFSWVPDFSNNVTVIVISDFSWDKEHWLRYFKEVEEIDTVKNIYASNNEWFIQHIFLCRKLKYNSTELEHIFKTEIF